MNIKLNDQNLNQIKDTNSKSISISAYSLKKLADIISGRINNIINSPITLFNITEYPYLKTKESEEYLEYIIEKENDQRMELATTQATKAVKSLKSIHGCKSDSEFVPIAKENNSKIIR